MNKIFIFILTLNLLMLSGCNSNIRTLCDIKNKGYITVVTNAVFPPFEYFKSGQVEGIDIDISREIAKDLGVKLEILEMGFDGVIAAVASGKGDFVAAGLTIDKNKERSISFSDEYITVPQSLIVIKDDNIKDVSDLKGKKIGTQIGTTSDKYMTESIKNGFLKNSNTELIEKKEYLDLVVDLNNNRLNVIALDGLMAREIVKKNNNLRYFDREDESYALAVKCGNNELLCNINKTIKRLKKNGEIIKFYKRHYRD